jgi:hypothetical protein
LLISCCAASGKASSNTVKKRICFSLVSVRDLNPSKSRREIRDAGLRFEA